MEIKRKKLELSRVEMARKELEFKIDERAEEIIKLQGFVEIQIKKEEELKVDLLALSNKGE